MYVLMIGCLNVFGVESARRFIKEGHHVSYITENDTAPLIVWLSLFLLKRLKITDKAYVLIVRYDPAVDNDVRLILAQNKHEVKSKSSGADGIELTVQLRLRGDNHQLVHHLTDIQGVQHAVLVQYTGDYAS